MINTHEDDYSVNIIPICCQAHRVNHTWKEAEIGTEVGYVTIEPQTFCDFKDIKLKTIKIRGKNKQYVIITWCHCSQTNLSAGSTKRWCVDGLINFEEPFCGLEELKFQSSEL